MVTMQISLGFHFRIETRMEDYARFFLPYRILFTSNVVGNWKIEAFLIDIEDIERNLQAILFGFCARWKVVQEILKQNSIRNVCILKKKPEN